MNNFEKMLNNITLGDSYKLLKDIPDNSIDLVYIDIPYEFADGGCNSSPLSQRIKKLKQQDLKGLTNGIDYSIFDDLCRVLKTIYIYMV